jgi:hypothetical protein
LVSSSVYIFDYQHSNRSIFLGAADIRVDHGEVSLNSIPETYLAMTSSHFTRGIKVADRNWTITVVPTDTSLDLLFIILGGCIIFVGCIVAAVWFHLHLERIAKQTTVVPVPVPPKSLKQASAERAE